MPNIVKNTTFPGLFDLLAPHSCRGCGAIGSALCNRCKKYIITNRKNICPNCKEPFNGPKCPHCSDFPPTYIVDERNTLIGTLVHDLKYDSVRALAPHIADLLNQIIPKLQGSVEIVPLPTITKHIRSRGLDHTKLIAKHLAKHRPIFHTSDVLIRAKDTVQVGASAKTRATQASEAYLINPKVTIDPSKTYLFLDDVWTTGASMHAAIKKLSSTGADNIIVVILALSTI